MLVKREARGTAWTGNEYGVQRRFSVLGKSGGFNEKIVFDIGCGAGGYSTAAAKSAKCVISIDIDKKSVQNAKKNLQRVQKHSNLHYVIANAETLPIRSESGDVVLLIEVIEHVDNETETLAEIHRVLKTESILLITAPNRFYLFETHGMKVLKTELGNLLGIGIPFLSWAPRILRDKLQRARIYTQKDLACLISRCGFSVLRIDCIMPPLDRLKTSDSMRLAIRRVLAITEKTPFVQCMGAHVALLARKN
jgi:SAM-dependent methyltransferase